MLDKWSSAESLAELDSALINLDAVAKKVRRLRHEATVSVVFPSIGPQIVSQALKLLFDSVNKTILGRVCPYFFALL